MQSNIIIKSRSLILLVVFLNFSAILTKNYSFVDTTDNHINGNSWHISADGNDLYGNGSISNPFRTIQKGIDKAIDGDQILVLEGRYSGKGNKNLDFRGKAITVQSRNPEDEECVRSTIIDAEGDGVIVRFVNDEGQTSVFKGFTLIPGGKTKLTRGVPGYFEFSQKARPTTGMLRVTDLPTSSNYNMIIPDLVDKISLGRVWNGNNPFHQPFVTTDYYGSGDLNGDGIFTTADISMTQEMADGNIEPSFKADVDGNGLIDQEDVSRLTEALHNKTVLPGLWNNLNIPDQRNSWIDKIIAIDRSDEHPYYFGDLRYVCRDFAVQLFINSATYRGDLFATDYGGGKRGFNIPLYYTGVRNTSVSYGHAINAILIGDNPLSFNDWRFIEPQDDGDVNPGDWNMPFGTTVEIFANGFQEFFSDSRILITFKIVESGVKLVDHDPDLIITRPMPFSSPPNNRVDSWRPRIIPNEPGKIIYEQQRDDLSRMNDIYLTDFPQIDPQSSTPLKLPGLVYNRLLDAFIDSNGTVHLLWTGKLDYIPGVFYGELNMANQVVSNITRISNGVREPLMGRLLVTPENELHIFWLEQKTYYNNAGIYWAYWNDSGWHDSQNLTPEITQRVFRLVQSIDDHEAINYYFDVAMSESNEIFLVYTTQLSAASFENDNPTFIKKYDGAWNAASVVGNPPIEAFGLDISFDSKDKLHIFYWFTLGEYNFYGLRGNLYHITFNEESWSTPILVDQSGLAGYPQSVSDSSGKLYLVWERLEGEQSVPVWNQYDKGFWNSSQVLGVSTNADAWYPNVNIMSDGNLIFSWTSHSPDSVIIDMEYAVPLPPLQLHFLSLIRK